MRVRVRCFARLRELVGRSEIEVEVPPGSTLADVWGALVSVHPAARSMSSSISAARNAEFASMAASVHDGDEVAFLPPVSGGALRDR